MTLKEQIQADKVFSQKYGIKVLNLLLSTVLGELDRKTKTPTTDSTKLLRTSNGEVIDYVHNFGEMDWKEQVYGGAVKKNETGTTATITGPTSNKPS